MFFVCFRLTYDPALHNDIVQISEEGQEGESVGAVSGQPAAGKVGNPMEVFI